MTNNQQAITSTEVKKLLEKNVGSRQYYKIQSPYVIYAKKAGIFYKNIMSRIWGVFTCKTKRESAFGLFLVQRGEDINSFQKKISLLSQLWNNFKKFLNNLLNRAL